MPAKRVCPPCTADCAQGDWCPARERRDDHGYIIVALMAAIALAIPFWVGVYTIAAWALGVVLP